MSDRYFQGMIQRRVDHLRPGDRVDLENDCFADPDGYVTGGQHTQHPEFQFEFEVVLHSEFETFEPEGCICVYFESGFACGFPADHWIDIDGEQARIP